MSDPRCPGGLACVCGAELTVVYLPRYNDEFPEGIQMSDAYGNCCEFTREQAVEMAKLLAEVIAAFPPP